MQSLAPVLGEEAKHNIFNNQALRIMHNNGFFWTALDIQVRN